MAQRICVTGASGQAIVAKLMTEEPRRLIPQRRSVPPYVEDAVLTALEKLPADRFGTAAEFGRALGDGERPSITRGARYGADRGRAVEHEGCDQTSVDGAEAGG